MFDRDEAFAEFVGKFKKKGNRLETRALWDHYMRNIESEEAAAQHAHLLADLTDYARANWSPGFTLERLGVRLPTMEPPPPIVTKPANSSTRPEAPTASPSSSAFKAAKASWPTDPTRVAELEKNAKFAWDRSVAAYGLAATIAACAYYTKKSRGLAHPLNMATWLEDGDVKAYAAEYAKKPDETAVAAFRAVYPRYPRPALDEDEALDLFAHRIEPADRLPFAAAVVEYAEDRGGKEKKYIKKWSSFVAGEWREREWGPIAIRAVEAAIEEAQGKLEYVDRSWSSCANMVEDIVAQHNEHLAQLRAEYDTAEPFPVAGTGHDSWPQDGWQPGLHGDEPARREPIETDRFVRAAQHIDAGQFGVAAPCIAAPCRCICRGWPPERGRCHPHRWSMDRDRENCADCWAAGRPGDCRQDPCTCGKRKKTRHGGPCGRTGCEAEPCACGRWVVLPPPDLVVDVASVLARAYEILVVPPALPQEQSEPLPWV